MARELSARARASAAEAMATAVAPPCLVPRTGITGPPGAGKSSVIAQLVRHWLDGGQKVGVLAIDPTSPLSGGSLLGDRVRMDEVASSPDLYVRSIPSGSSVDGLCSNVSAMLDTLDAAGFDEILLETVGVGQVSYEARLLVDTFVLVLVPESGDTVQAMKAGVMETADIYLVNKADLPGAAKLATELRSIAKWRSRADRPAPAVIESSVLEQRGFKQLSEEILRHRSISLGRERRAELHRAREVYRLKALLLQRFSEVLEGNEKLFESGSVRMAFDLMVEALGLESGH